MKKLLASILLVFVLALVSVSAAGNLTVGIDQTSQSGDPGASLTYTLTFTNIGLTDIASITVVSDNLINGGNVITAPTISGVTNLDTINPKTVQFTVDIPTGLPSGTYSGTITATDDADSNNFETIPYDVVINAVDEYTVDVSSLSFSTLPDNTAEETFTITNTGSTTLVGWTAVFTSDDGDIGFIEDNDNDRIDITFLGLPSTLSPGGQATVTVFADADSKMDEGNNYDGTIAVSASGTASDANIDVNVDIIPEICEDGKVGSDWDINIQEPDSSDEFNAGDTVTVEVEVENRANEDLDATVEVILYNEDEGDVVKTEKEDISIDEDETEDITIEIDLPTDLDANDNFVLYVQVHEDGNEDDSCDFESEDLDIERENEDAVITETNLIASSSLMCGDDYTVTVDVESIGDDDLKDVYVEVIDGDLDVTESSVQFDLGDYNDNDNDYRITFNLEVPEDLDAGTYYLEAKLYDEDGSVFDSELIAVELDSCNGGSSTITETTPTVTTTTSSAGGLKVTVDDNYDVKDDELTLTLIVENEGDEAKELSLDVQAVAWADLDDVELIDVLGPGDSVHGYVYLTLDPETEGQHSLQIAVSDDVGNEISEIVTVDFGEAPEVVEQDLLFSGLFTGNGTGSGNKAFWIIADVVLILLALVFLKSLFSKR